MAIKKAFMHLIAHDIDVLHGNRLKNKKGKPLQGSPFHLSCMRYHFSVHSFSFRHHLL